MAKARSSFVCRECGGSTPKWAGQCPDCGAWNSLEEMRQASAPAGRAPVRAQYAGDSGIA